MDDLSAGEKVIVFFLTAFLVIGGIVTLRSFIIYGSPLAVFNISFPAKEPAVKSNPEPEPVIQTVTATVTENLNFRPAPNNNNTPIKVLAGGTKVEVISVENGWANVVDNTGAEGFVSNLYLRY